MPKIGFLIIGAPKAGTTSLFEYMRVHPQIHMPAEKEVYFFNMDRNYQRGWDWYVSTVSRDACEGAICGEATTEYMSGVPYDDTASQSPHDQTISHIKMLEEIIPRRIHTALPDVRLICVLRDPVKRAHSHHRMMALSNVESRSFERAVDELLEPATLEQARRKRSRVNGYIVNGEYARLLNGFLRVFPREQLKVILSQDLSARPEQTLADVFRFVGADGSFVPSNVNTRYRTAAVKQRIPGINLVTWQTTLARAHAMRRCWHALPDGIRCRVDRAYNVANYRVELWNAVRGVVGEDMPATVHRRLAAHYRPDSEALSELLGRDVPWLASWSSTLQ